MAKLTSSATREERVLLIAFVDLTGFALQCSRIADREVADTVDALYQRVGAAVTGAGGEVVKFIGDAALMVFTEDDVDRAVTALLALKDEVDGWLAGRGWPCHLQVKAHVGTVIAGPFGGAGDQRFDVIGKNVNLAAMLESTGVALSAEAFARLGPATAARFKAHSGPVTYGRVEDLPRFRRR